MKMILTMIASLAIIFTANADDYRLSKPDMFGNRTITGPNGFRGKISHPDMFGNQRFQYNDGTKGTISGPDMFGNRRVRVTHR